LVSKGRETSAFELLHPGLQRLIAEKKEWKSLRPIQEAAIAPILEGLDCVLEAPTAGGKTEAVLFPTLTAAAKSRQHSVRVLYLAPLRALLNNLEGRGERYAAACNLEAFKWHGDVSQKAKVDRLRLPPHLLLTTPESLEAILLRKAEWREFFAGLQTIIIDEAHNFAGGDRGGHLLALMERVGEAVDNPPQRIAMTATIGNPHAMLQWLAGSERALGRRLHVDGRSPPADYRVAFFDESQDCDDTPAEERAAWRRFLTLHRELVEKKKAIVFVRSRTGAEAIAKMFLQVNLTGHLAKVNVRTHHSNVSRFFREEAERLIQVSNEAGLNAIISTSTLELGIDIGELETVVQLDGLSSSSSFLQRVGRTGRRPGKPRVFRGLCTDPEDLPLLVATVNLGIRGKSEALALPRRAFHLLAHQLLCLALQNLGISPTRAWTLLRPAFCFSGITETEFQALVDHMVEADYLRWVSGDLLVAEKAEKEYLGAGWRRLFAVFDSAPLYEVLDRKNQVGTLDSHFVECLEVPFYFVLGGKLWQARSVDPKRRIVKACRASGGDPPRWHCFGGPDVPFETAQEVGRILQSDEAFSFLDEAALAQLEAQRWVVAELGWEAGRTILRVSEGGEAKIWTFAGDRINRTLARTMKAASVGRATARYDAVTIKGGAAGSTELSKRIQEGLDRLGRGDLSDPLVLTSHLARDQPLWPFSPFARCLPHSLWAEALVEMTTDCEGTIRLVQCGSRD
jgi:ATP-dependent Lhr-like helicase